MQGGTKQKNISELTSSYARHMRRNESVVAAREQYVSKKAAAKPKKPKAIPKPKVRRARVAISKKIPAQLGQWMAHVAAVKESKPNLPYSQVLHEAKASYKL